MPSVHELLTVQMSCHEIFQPDTAMDECLQSFGYFHTKMAFSRGHLETNWFNNFLILLRVKQNVYGEHKLKFWIKNIHEFQKPQECL